MATDDERLEVAERLRVGADRQSDHTMSVYLCLAVLGDDFAERFNRGELRRELFDRLADLIDPDCDEGRYEGVHTARPVDREALLAEAKEAEKSAWYFALDHDENELRDRLTEAAEEFSDVARRIREACGEVVV